MAERRPSFDLIAATVDRDEELRPLLDSLERQTYRRFRLLLVDQNGDERVEGLLPGRELDVLRLPSPRGLSRARNIGLAHVKADVVAFPDDDCSYPSDLLERVARRLAGSPELDGVTGGVADAEGRVVGRWRSERGLLARDNVWHSGVSASIFLRRETVDRIGPFDEQLGLGSPGPWSSGEEIDFLVRALDLGARIEYDPQVVVTHDVSTYSPAGLRSVGRRDGASVGYILRKHRFPARTVARMLVRPLGGAALSLLRGDVARARFHVSTLRGRIAGYAGAARR